MHIYLQPEDDSLLMRPSGRWAIEKLDYVARYINVFETSMRNKWSVRYYVDLMAGPGKNRLKETGQIILDSPLLALTTTYPFTGYFFADLSEGNTQALQQRCTASPHCERVNILTGDCNVLVENIVVRIKRDDWRSLNLAFLDPEGLELKWETVAKLASVRRMDLIINYPQGGLNRCMRQAFEAEHKTIVDLFFGGQEWREVYRSYLQRRLRGSIHRHLVDLYKGKLQNLGYQEVRRDDETGDEPLIRNAARRAPMYRLLFASKHLLGHEFWQSILKRDVYGQRRLL